MLYRTIVSTLPVRRPYITLSLLFASVATTVPQFFLPELYDTLTGTLFGFRPPHFFLLHAFSHSPSILLPHFLGNLLVLLFFGTISEALLGTRRFAMLTVVTLSVTVAAAYARDLATIHGLSGIIWGYHMPVLFLLLAIAQKRAGVGLFLRDPIVLTALPLLLFDFLGIHVLEVHALGLRPFENFGQVMHLVSALLGAAFAYVWRGEIDRAASAAVRSMGLDPVDWSTPFRSPVVILLWALLLLNAVGTVDAGVMAAGSAGKVAYTLEPPLGSSVPALGRGATVVFSEDMIQRPPTVSRRSIWYEEPPTPEVAFQWRGERKLRVRLNRPLTENEALLLNFKAYREGPRGMILPVSVELRYGTPPDSGME